MRRPALGILIIVIGTVSILRLTSAFFSDTETSSDNTLQAGELDLKIDNTSYYNEASSSATTWPSDNLPGHLFFDFNDLKPGDRGEDTISLSVQNPAWACMKIKITQNTDESCTEPEIINDPSCPDTGDLAQQLNFVFWADDGDNIHQLNEPVIKEGTASAIFNDDTWTLADSLFSVWPTPGPIPASETRYIGKYWCFGILSPSANPPGFSCDGQNLNNSAQSDKVMADVEFTAIQSRHNPGFLCNGSITPTPPIISPTITPTPTPLACNQADVMLVLDRSGSINSTELAQLKTASKAFVDDLGLSSSGIHAGMSSFATSGTLNHILSSNSITIKAAIDLLVSGGFTNLKSGIDIAAGELAGVNDRPDGSSPDKMIVITDGHPNRPLPESTADDVAATSADAARAAGSEIFVVGVGSDVDATYLQNEIADDAGHYFPISNYSDLQTALQNLDLCD
ncbi:MAG: hypothetical protein G01um101416_207 [Microgenomates group bacterium Gr01-1014_16]|nr:MAG: hypothetical protein G01um101416_207 [Microgenomates group bacterium Gr01-1014_16]